MSQATIDRISNVLHRQFDGLVDMTDWAKKPPEHIEGAFLSRSLAALAVKTIAKISPEAAAQSITDGMDDNGIDAIYFDAPADTLILIQSKWSGSGNNTFDEGASSKFVNGVRTLLAGDFTRFNDRIRAKEAEIREVLYADRAIKLRLVLTHTSAQPTAPHVKRIVESFVAELNDPVPIADYTDYAQSGVYELITAESRDPKIKLQVVLNDWGMIERPFLAYYGRVSVTQIMQWWEESRNKLFSQNLRLFYPNSDVNNALQKTLLGDPESFWYFNNGITVISDKIVKGVAGSPAHKFGNFTCEGASIVNGAQTVGTIGNSFTPSETGAEDASAWVQVRLISLEKCPPDFGRKVTRAANLQNAVGTREFAAMDPIQHRLAIEFALDKRRYVYKSGESDPRGDEGCGIVEATQALGCAHSVKIAVDVKREIGSIWSDIEASPYTDIFNERLSAEKLWRSIQVMRTADEMIQALRNSSIPKADLIGIHMNRILLHLVFQDKAVRIKYQDGSPIPDLVAAVKLAVPPIFADVSAYLVHWHDGEYLASLCKNHGKCSELVSALTAPKPFVGKQEEMLLVNPV